MIFEQAVVEELIFDPKQHFFVAQALVDVPLGPFRITPFEAFMAVRKTGTPFSKELRSAGYNVPKVLTGPPLELGRAQILESLIGDAESLKMGALVLAAHEAEKR